MAQVQLRDNSLVLTAAEHRLVRALIRELWARNPTAANTVVGDWMKEHGSAMSADDIDRLKRALWRPE